MSAERASIFDGDDLDVSDFQATPIAKRPRPDKTAIRQAAETRGFTSREPETPPAPTTARAGEGRAPRRHTTGRNRQLNLKVTDDAVSRFYTIADARGWVLGEAFERALDALERELGQAKT